MIWKRLAILVFSVVLIYVLSYALFRISHTEIWEKDGRRYVIFPKSWTTLYYCYRPITYVDGAITGIGFHIGPHQ